MASTSSSLKSETELKLSEESSNTGESEAPDDWLASIFWKKVHIFLNIFLFFFAFFYSLSSWHSAPFGNTTPTLGNIVHKPEVWCIEHTHSPRPPHLEQVIQSQMQRTYHHQNNKPPSHICGPCKGHQQSMTKAPPH